MKKFLLFIGLLICVFTHLSGQELNCQVMINSDQIIGTNKQVFQSMQKDILEFLNLKKWSEYQYQNEEKIDCNILITIESQSDEKTFSGNIQIQARRPIYNSSYYSSILNFKDKDFNFEYIEMTPLEFVDNTFESNLTAMLAYYAYLIIGLDNDSYESLGGTNSLKKAENIVNLAQSQNVKGWKAFDDMRNRFALINNMLDEKLRKLRLASYQYHRLGLDAMAADVAKGRLQVTEALKGVKEANSLKPSCVAVSSFLDAKRDEIINIYSKAPMNEKKEVYELLMDIDPGQSTRYEEILKP